MSDCFTIQEENGYRLVGREQDDKRTVVRIGNGQVLDAMPNDAPGGWRAARRPGCCGSWVARDCDAGIDYVASWYSRSYARRVYRELVKEAAPYEA